MKKLYFSLPFFFASAFAHTGHPAPQEHGNLTHVLTGLLVALLVALPVAALSFLLVRKLRRTARSVRSTRS